MMRWDSILINEFKILNEDKVLIYHDIPKGDFIANTQLREFYQYTLYENEFRQATRLDLTILARNPIGFPNPISVSNDEVLFTAPWDYNVYKLINDRARPVFRLDFGKYSYTSGELKNLSDSEKEVMENNGQRISGMGIVQKTDSFLMFTIALKGDPVTYFHSFDSGHNYCLNDSFREYQLPTCFTWSSTGQNSFLAFVDARDMKDFMKNNSEFQHLSVNESDNPYLIIYSIVEE